MSLYSENKFDKPTMSVNEVEKAMEFLFPDGDGIDPYELYSERDSDEETYSIEDVCYLCNGGDEAPREQTYKITEVATGKFGYITFEGERGSWDGGYWDDDYMISEPVEKTVTGFYSRKKD